MLESGDVARRKTGGPAGRASRLAVAALLAMGIGAADLLTKRLVQVQVSLYDQVQLIGDYVRLTHIYNPGAAFGISLGSYSRPVFLLVTIVALIAIVAMLVRVPGSQRSQFFALVAITGGALGNLANRILIERGVVDWIDIGVNTVRWPVFNLADVAITTGAVLLAIMLWRGEKAAPDGIARERG